jgi:hypothetical protein
MPDLQSFFKDDLLTGILMSGGAAYAFILLMIMLYHMFSRLLKREKS